MNKCSSVALFALALSCALAQDQPGGTAEVRILVTAEPIRGSDALTIHEEDILAFQDQDRLTVTDWVRCEGEQAALELFILLDDSSETSLASQFQDIRDFVHAQPATTAIGIGYMRNGIVETVHPLTADHAQAVTKLRLPIGGGAGSNPYASLNELIRSWPRGSARREVLMLTSGVGGIDLGSDSFHNIFVDAAIADAQRAGIIVHAVYALGAGHRGHSLWFNLRLSTTSRNSPRKREGRHTRSDSGRPSRSLLIFPTWLRGWAISIGLRSSLREEKRQV